MRIAFIINDLSGGGAEKSLQILAGFLLGSGVEVKVITLHTDADVYDLPAGVELTTLRTGRLSRGAGKIAMLPLSAWELARAVRAWAPDVCVSNLPRSNIAHVMTRWFGNRRPVLVTEHIATAENYPSARLGNRAMRALIRASYRNADGVLAVSQGVADGLAALGVARAKIRVIFNPVCLQSIETQAREHLASGTDARIPTVITVGRHAEQKRHDVLLRAFALVRRELDARLILVGRGPLRPALEQLARTLGIDDAVVFTGWQRNPFAWMSRADVFVLSSSFEGFGNVLVEAMACGLPVISTDCRSGPREILRDGAGMLVPVDDVTAMADAMLRVLSNAELRSTLSRAARRRAADFDIGAIGPGYLELLRSFRRQSEYRD